MRREVRGSAAAQQVQACGGPPPPAFAAACCPPTNVGPHTCCLTPTVPSAGMSLTAEQVVEVLNAAKLAGDGAAKVGERACACHGYARPAAPPFHASA